MKKNINKFLKNVQTIKKPKIDYPRGEKKKSRLDLTMTSLRLNRHSALIRTFDGMDFWSFFLGSKLMQDST